jgi:hypothetical protein
MPRHAEPLTHISLPARRWRVGAVVAEGLIRADPERHLQNALVCNLSMMYDLAAHRAKERKRTLQQLAQRYASDDFDQTVLKLS